MKNIKILLWLIFLAFIGLVFFQNKDFFVAYQELTLNLYFNTIHKSLELPVAVWFLIVLIVGFMVAYFFALIDRFKTKTIIKGMRATSDVQREMITQLKKELESRAGFDTETIVDAETIPANSASVADGLQNSSDDK